MKRGWKRNLLSIVVSLPVIIMFLTGKISPVKIFGGMPHEDFVKSVVLKKHPVWKPIESKLENTIPNSSAHVSVEVIQKNKKTVNLNVNLIVDKELSEEQVDSASTTICDVLNEYGAGYDKVTLSVGNFSSYHIEKSIVCKE